MEVWRDVVILHEESMVVGDYDDAAATPCFMYGPELGSGRDEGCGVHVTTSSKASREASGERCRTDASRIRSPPRPLESSLVGMFAAQEGEYLG